MLTQVEVDAKLEACTHPRVTKESIEAKIADTEFLYSQMTTICIITMVNGFRFIGTSTPADRRNYDADIGRHYAYENAFKQIWTHEGYLLKQSLYMGEVA